MAASGSYNAVFPTVTELVTTEELKGTMDESRYSQPKWANIDVIWVGRTKGGQNDHIVLYSHLPYLLDCGRAHGIDVVFTEFTQGIIEDYSQAIIEGSAGPYRVKYADI